MAVTTLDQLVAGLLAPEYVSKASFTGQAAGQFHTSLYLAGRPGAAAAPSPGINGAALSSTSPTSPGYAGQIPFPAAVTAKSVYLAGFDATQAANIGAVVVCDRLWHNSGIAVTTTGAQAITTPAYPARDLDGTVNGRGIMLGLEVTTATTNGAPVTTITASYTNSAGTAGQSMSIPSFPANAVAGTFVPFNFAAGDQGHKALASVTLGTSLVSGAVSLVAYRPILTIPVITANIAARLDAIQAGLPKLFDGSVPWLLYLLTGTAAGITQATVNWAQN
jgi:hypothetical protein